MFNFFTRQVQRFSREISNFKFQISKTKPPTSDCPSVVLVLGSAVCVAHKRVIFVHGGGGLVHYAQRRSWVVLRSCPAPLANEVPDWETGSRPRKLPCPRWLWCVAKRNRVLGSVFALFCFWTRNFLLAGYENCPYFDTFL